MKRQKQKGVLKMENLYILQQSCRPRRIERAKVIKALNVFYRCCLVIGFIVFIGIWAGAENSELMFGRRLLWTATDLLFMAVCSKSLSAMEDCDDE